MSARYAARELITGLCLIVVLASGCASESTSEVAAGAQVEPEAVEGAQINPGALKPSDNNADMAVEQLETGDWITCFPGQADYQFSWEPALSTLVDRYVEFDPATIQLTENGLSTAESIDGEIYLGPVTARIANSPGRYRAGIDTDGIAHDVQELSAQHADLWLSIRVCHASPYVSLFYYQRDRGLPVGLSGAAGLLAGLYGEGDDVEQTATDIVAWIDSFERHDPLVPVTWGETDPGVRQFEDAPSDIELLSVELAIRVPESWRSRESPALICLRTEAAWSGCILTTAVDDYDYTAFGIPLSGARLSGESVSVVLLNEQADLRGANVQLGVITSDELDDLGGDLEIDFRTAATPTSVLESGLFEFEWNSRVRQPLEAAED